MTEKVYLFDMFSDYEPPEALKSALSQAAIVAADIDAQRRRISVAIHSEHYIPKKDIDQAVKESIVELIREIANSGKFGFIMVTHDIAMSAKVCENLLVMSEGKIVEQGKTDKIMTTPQSEITKTLIEVATDVKRFWGIVK